MNQYTYQNTQNGFKYFKNEEKLEIKDVVEILNTTLREIEHYTKQSVFSYNENSGDIYSYDNICSIEQILDDLSLSEHCMSLKNTLIGIDEAEWIAMPDDIDTADKFYEWISDTADSIS